MKTSFPKPAKAQWYIVDASDKVLGRLSVQIANVLRGRHRPQYVPHWKSLDHVIVLNAEKVKVTGNKMEDKRYYRHAGYLGHLRSTSMKDVLEKNPARILEASVKGMLPKNATRPHILKQLHVVVGSVHTHEAQQPLPFPLPL